MHKLQIMQTDVLNLVLIEIVRFLAFDYSV